MSQSAQTNSGLTYSQIIQAANSKDLGWAAPLAEAMQRFGINTPKRQAAFLAQIGYESDGLVSLEESLNYSKSALLAVFPTHFSAAQANLYGRTPTHPANQQAIANIAYANRYGNGDVASGDGYRYRGRGPIQITFLDNYVEIKNNCNIDCVANPDLLCQYYGGSLSAAYYWYSHKCNELADADDFTSITEEINGGLNGLQGRVAMWTRAKNILGVA